ncbi:MAG: DUF4271 domain-containing protein [Alistipes sp.]|nr:DUF4271 domain-containing protein [Alistipes sp.]
MEQTINHISAQTMFGAASELVVEQGNGVLSGIASLGTMYQIATGVVALLFIFIMVRYFDLVRYLLLSTVSKRIDRSDIHIYSADINNIEIVTSLAGVSLISLLIMRLTVTESFQPLLAPLVHLPAWGIGGLAFASILTMMFGERIMLLTIGAVSGRNSACNSIWHIKLLHFSLAIILLSPLLILALLTEGRVAQIALFTSVAVCSVTLILFVKETFSLFRAQRFSIFHWILYLCALEIFPLSLLLAPILRG